MPEKVIGDVKAKGMYSGSQADLDKAQAVMDDDTQLNIFLETLKQNKSTKRVIERVEKKLFGAS